MWLRVMKRRLAAGECLGDCDICDYGGRHRL
jgi:hypothetical protein